MPTADRVVSRIYIYAPADPADKSEPSFSITGSQFENLRIAGYKVDVQLATPEFHALDTHSEAAKAEDWLLASQLAKKGEKELQRLENTYHALKGIARLARHCNENREKKSHHPPHLIPP